MTIRLQLLPYGPSDSCIALRNAIREVITTDRLDANITLLKSDGTSRYRPRRGDVVINYGNRRYDTNFFGQATVLNPVAALNRAANKLQAFNTLSQAGVPTVEYTIQQQIAQTWVNEGAVVYARTVLNGHSGGGIVVHTAENSTVGAAPLYTKGITAQRREWRVHVFEGKISYVQLKRRRNGYREDPNYREDVRNHSTGWIYATADITPSDAVLRAAFDAVTALGLNFGAVDLISRGDEAWVLEVNTAPGLTGTTLETYQHNFIEYAKAAVLGTAPEYLVAYEVPAARPAATAETEEAAPAPAPVAAPAVETVSTPPSEAEQRNVRVGGQNSSYSRGMYLVDIVSEAQNVGVVANNVILYYANGRFFRHGWNQPLESATIRNARRIESLTVEGRTAPITL